MPAVVRRVRAALVVAASWAVAWGAVGLLASLLDGAQSGHYPGYPDVAHWWLSPLYLARRFGDAAMIGAVSGLLFAAVVAVAERGRTVRLLSRVRTAAWGAAVGGGLFALAWRAFQHMDGAGWSTKPFPLAQLALAAVGGAGLATFTLWIARRAAPGAGDPTAVGGAEPPSAFLGEGDAPAQPIRQSARARVT